MTKTAARMNSGKPMLSFVLQFPTAIASFARVKELGAAKYERDNWKLGGKPDHEYLDACLRHLTSHVNGETFADDSGCTHLGHALWNIMALIELNYPGVTHDPETFDDHIQYWNQMKVARSAFPLHDDVARTREQYLSDNVEDLGGGLQIDHAELNRQTSSFNADPITEVELEYEHPNSVQVEITETETEPPYFS